MSTIQVHRAELQRLGERLSERDWGIVRFIGQHRYATTDQLRRACFIGHVTQSAATRACVRVLDRLLGQRILTRLERRVGGVRHGSAGFVWCLDVLGDRLTQTEQRSRRRVQEPSPSFLTHTLAVAETHVQLQEAVRDGAFRLTAVQVETEAWREYVAPSGAKSILKPDLMVTLGSDAYDDHWYIEIDLGTESMPVLLRKCWAYEDYRRTGRAQAEHGVFPRVLWVLPTPERTERLKARIAAEPRLPGRLFTCITPEGLLPTMRASP
ncbi:MAG: replication-relaxation family protein [Thermomicrobiales bacterium]